MRRLNSTEQALLRKIINKECFRFRDLFSEHLLSNVKLSILRHPLDVKIFLSQNINDGREVVEELVSVLGFVKLLEKYDLLLRFRLELQLSNQTFGDLNTQNIPQRKFLFGDASLKREIMTYVYAEFFVTEELRDFYKRGFRTRDEIRHRQIMLVSWVAIIIAFLGSLYGIWRREPQDRFELLDRIEAVEEKTDSIENQIISKENQDPVERRDTLQRK